MALTRDSDEKSTIRRKAFRRFLHGCPPRKQSDTSIGDAVNWEWLVHCAIKHNAEIHIASRDSDYGVTFENRSYINDHLLQEFRERVSKKRGVYLHTRLSEALKQFEVPITVEEENEEEAILTNRKASAWSEPTHESLKDLFKLLNIPEGGKISEPSRQEAAKDFVGDNISGYINTDSQDGSASSQQPKRKGETKKHE